MSDLKDVKVFNLNSQAQVVCEVFIYFYAHFDVIDEHWLFRENFHLILLNLFYMKFIL